MSRKPALSARWSKRHRDLLYNFDRYPPDGHFLHGLFSHVVVDGKSGRNLVQELEARGFDVTTVRFSIQRKEQS